MKTDKKEQKLFTSDDITVSCPRGMQWREMEEVKDGRFCTGCQEKLYYVGGYTKMEVMELQRKHGNNICVGVSTLHDVPVVVGLPIFVESEE